MKKNTWIVPAAVILCLSLCAASLAAAENRGIESGQRYDRVVIRNVTVIDGKGTPARGPLDIIVENNRISAVRSANRSPQAYEKEAHVLDGTGLYALPGLINNHAHIHDSRGRNPIPFEYLYKIWLACGITTVRDVGSNTQLTLEEREKSAEGSIAAPRIFLYMRCGGGTPEQARRSVQRVKEAGADAWDDAAFGVSTVEHWYGVPDAALPGAQNFPPWYNYNDENHRFRYAGHLWREAAPGSLQEVLRTMVDKGVGWCPTFVIYEANRDLVRAQNQPWFKDYLHPVLEEYFKPDPANHGSYFWNWTTEDEVFWKENFKIWMKAVLDFARMGGVVGCGEDAGYIYMLYGFSLIRELELHQEAGFHPLDVIQNATGNNARLLGLEKELGRLRAGFLADLILVEGNPLENMKYLYPNGVTVLEEGKMVKKGGVLWTIKDGFIYHAPSLLQDIKKMVEEARGK